MEERLCEIRSTIVIMGMVFPTYRKAADIMECSKIEIV